MQVTEAVFSGIKSKDFGLELINPLSAGKESEQIAAAPVAKKIRVDHELHGDKRPDDYHWLRDKEDPDTIAYLQNWNEYTSQCLEPLKELSDTLYKEFVGRLDGNDQSVPYQVGEYHYYTRLEEEKDYPLYCRKSVEGGKETLLLDGNQYAKTVPYFHVMGFEPSPNGRFIAFSIDTDGSQFGSIHIWDTVEISFVKGEVLAQSDGQVLWNSKSTGLWYVQVNEEMRGDKVRFHAIGTTQDLDPIIEKEEDPLFEFHIHQDKMDRWIFITSSSKDTSEVIRGPLDGSGSGMQVVHSRQKGLKVNLIPGDDRHYVRYSQDKKNWGLMSVGGDKMALQDWIPVAPSDSRVDIVDVEVFKEFLVLVKRVDGTLQIEVNNLKDNSSHKVPLPQDICEMELEHNDQFDSRKLRFSYSSPIHPESVFLYDMEKKELKLLKLKKAGGFEPENYTLERIWAPADDGTPIPITVYYKKGLERDGTSPLYLYAYGSYGITLDPYFSTILASFLERGVFCAIAHVRGGGDLGRQWYAQGSMLKKRNTFTDFINCAEYLITQGYTSSERLAVRGGSAGGLLMGAALNMRPDLFKVCLAEVPFVDVVTTMLDETLPLTTQEWKEWGNPKEKRYYEYQKSYSPYDNTRAQNYPALFVTAGLNDAQVSYHEPAKWVAKLLEYKTNSAPLLFRVNMGAGHHGSSGRYQIYTEMAPKFAFLLDQIGVNK